MNKKGTISSFIYYLLLIGLVIIFREPISSIVDTILVQPIFSNISSNLATDLAFLLSLTAITSIIWENRDHRWINKCLGIVLILFFIFRFDGYWLYTSLHLFKSITYIDLIAVSSIILLGRHTYLLFRKSGKSQDKDTNLGFIEDNAIEEIKDDTYERNTVAEQIAKQIIATDNKKAFAIGITGVYGSGKTSFINLITNVLKNETYPPLVVNFNPWNTETPADLQKIFFDELSIALGKEDSALSSHLYNYYRRLSGKSTFIGDIVNNLRDVSVIFNRDLDDEKEKINKMMINLSRKIIIVIDDLDRLHNEEVIEVLRLIRNTANFGNITYLVAYDKQYVEYSIKKLNERTYKNYLDKIFQIEIPLPKSESHFISNALVRRLKQIIKPQELSYVKDQFTRLNFDIEYEEAISATFTNQRDIVRFVNSFSLAYAMISKEVDFVQLLYIQILKYKYPIAYDTLYERRNEVLRTSANSSVLNRSYSLRKVSDKRDDEYVILEILKKELSTYDLAQVKYILNHLFSLNLTLHDKNKTRTITNSEVFELFFTGRISSVGLSESDFVKNMLGDVKEIEPYITDQLDKGKYKPLLNRILKIKPEDFIDKEHYEEISCALVKIVVPAYTATESLSGFHFDNFILTHIDKRKTIIEKYYNGNTNTYSKHLSKLLSFHKESHLFIGEVARRLIAQNRNLETFPQNHFLKIQLDCLIEGLDRNPTVITPEVVWMFWGIREYYIVNESGETNDKEVKWNIHPKAIEILKHRIAHIDIRYLLQSLISKDMYNEGKYGLHNKLIQDVFKSIFWLKETVKHNENTDYDVRNEFWIFAEQYEQTGDYIEYDFKYFEIK